MLGNITSIISTTFETLETSIEKLGNTTGKGLDILDVEVDTSLKASKATQQAKVDLAIAEASYDLQKAQLKLKVKMTALQQLADEQNI